MKHSESLGDCGGFSFKKGGVGELNSIQFKFNTPFLFRFLHYLRFKNICKEEVCKQM